MNSSRHSSEARDGLGMNAADRGERVHAIPHFLKKEEQAPAPMTELALQRRQFEQAVATLASSMAQLPGMLQPVMREASEPLPGDTMGPQSAGTPLGAWLNQQTNIVAGLSRDLAILIHRIDL